MKQQSKKPFFKLKVAGFGITEVIIASGILAVLATIGLNFVGQVDQTRYRIEALSTRDALAIRTRRVLSKSNLEFSAQAFGEAGNQRLRACVDQNPGTICDATNPGSPVGFRLAYPNLGASQSIAGPGTNPVLYDHRGGNCEARLNCLVEFEVQTEFVAVCQDQARTCGDAQTLRVRYRVRNISLKNQPLIPSSPPDDEFNDPNRGFMTITINSAKLEGVCPAFTVLRSVNQSGEIRCECQPGAVRTGTINGQPRCAPARMKCPNNQTHRLIGYDENFNPICVPRPNWRCSTIRSEQDCGNGVIQAVRLGECRVENEDGSKKRGSNSYVTCDDNVHTCCSESRR